MFRRSVLAWVVNLRPFLPPSQSKASAQIVFGAMMRRRVTQADIGRATEMNHVTRVSSGAGEVPGAAVRARREGGRPPRPRPGALRAEASRHEATAEDLPEPVSPSGAMSDETKARAAAQAESVACTEEAAPA